jgi:hypothetical protein
MKFSKKTIPAEFNPVELTVTATSYEELHRIANNIGTVTSDVMKGVREQAKEAMRDAQVEGPTECVGGWCTGCIVCCPPAEEGHPIDIEDLMHDDLPKLKGCPNNDG